MKVVYLAILTFLLGISISAQITISHFDMPYANSVFMYHNTLDLISEDFSLTGANYNWDYSQATPNNNDTLNIVTVSSTPLAYQLFFNNPFQYPNHKADYAIAGQDLDVFGQVTIENRFDYYRVNNNSLEITGFGANINGVPASVKYDTIDQIYPFLIAYNMPTHYSSGYFLTTIPTLGTYGQHIKREVVADGWGSITTPTKTYPNTLRVKTTLYITDTIYVDQFSFGQTINRPIEVRYEWLTQTDNAPVMSVTQNGGQISNVKYLTPIAATIEESKFDLTIFPSNQEGIFNISNPQNFPISSIQCYDLFGRLLISEHYQFNSIDIRNYPNGVYLIHLESEHFGTITKKIYR